MWARTTSLLVMAATTALFLGGCASEVLVINQDSSGGDVVAEASSVDMVVSFETSPQDITSEQPGEHAATQTSSGDIASAPLLIGDIVALERERRTRVERLLEKGTPLIPTAWKEAMRFVAERSLDQVARDLGDPDVMFLCRAKSVYGYRSSNFWATALPPNLLFLRLVEEGREDPDRVSNILCESILAKLKSIAEIRKQQDSTPDLSKVFVYDSAVPAQFAIAGAFCALANIDRLRDPEAIRLLDAWIAMPQPTGYEASDIQLWLIDQYFGSLDESTSPNAVIHRKIANGRTLMTAPKTFLKWHQAYGMDEDGDAIEKSETLDILGIGSEMPFDSLETDRIRENFHDHVGKLAQP